VGTLGIVFINTLAFHHFTASSIATEEYLLFADKIMNLRYTGICPLLPTILATVISVGTVLQMPVVQISSCETINFVSCVNTLIWTWN
jgi:hypothetical protein